MNRRIVLACLVGAASGWNVGNIGGVTSQLAAAYGVGLLTIGLFTTVLFATHAAVQVPGGRASDRFGAAPLGLLGLVVIALGDAIALISSDALLGLGARAITGIGTGVSFIAGSALVREAGGSPLAQGIFGGSALGTAGLAIGVVPQIEAWMGWRAPYVSSLVIGVGAIALLGPVVRRTTAERVVPSEPPARHTGVAPRSLARVAILCSASAGWCVVLGNWVVELLQQNSGFTPAAAGAVGSLTLLGAIGARPLGGWLMTSVPERARAAAAASLLMGGAGTLALAVAEHHVVAVAAAALVGIGGGVPFAIAFTAAARARPEAPAAAVGVVNGATNFTVLAGIPLVGMWFSAGQGRLGFAAASVVWLVALLLLPRATAFADDRTGSDGENVLVLPGRDSDSMGRTIDALE